MFDPAADTTNTKPHRWLREVLSAAGYFIQDEVQVGKYSLDCVAPYTRILTSDLRWVPAESIQVGDKLVGFDEQSTNGIGAKRFLRETIVEAVEDRVADLIEISFADGRVVVCSTGHAWLMSGRSARGLRGGNELGSYKRSDSLLLGQTIRNIVFPWEGSPGYDEGWLGGFLDGEGWVTTGHGVAVGQRPGLVSTYLSDNLQRLKFEFGVSERSDGLLVFTPKGGMPEVLRLLGTSRPSRLLEKKPWIGAGLAKLQSEALIVGLKLLHKGPVVSIQTSEKTFIAEGLASHNCFVAEFYVGFEADGPYHDRRYQRRKDIERDLWILENSGIPIFRVKARDMDTLYKRELLVPKVQEFCLFHHKDIEQRRLLGQPWGLG